MQINDFVRVVYSAKIKETGQEFDKTGDKTAPIIVKPGFIIKGLEEALLEMNANERKTIEIPPEKAFGTRDPKLVRLIPISEFRKHNTKPQPGMFVQADNMRGRVLSVSGGRVRVDFNNPLAGKTLIYDLEIKEKIESIEHKIKTLFEIYRAANKDKIKVNVKEKEVEVEIPPLVNSLFKKKIADDIIKILNFEKVKYVEVFEKPKEEVKT
ncbi:MAG: peptidylprolyl isomerase [Candidatus Aenigmarchaeota archaeon]|nr:peptidylprolyl isomerase [Candidatus Aenigmarchaeota archaeon]